QGLFGGRAYAEKHAGDITNHVIAAESDFGAGRIYGFDSSAREGEKAAVDQMAAAPAPLGIEAMPGDGSPGSDIGPPTRKGTAWAWLGHDGTDDRELRHSAEDTREKSVPRVWAQNVAA